MVLIQISIRFSILCVSVSLSLCHEYYVAPFKSSQSQFHVSSFCICLSHVLINKPSNGFYQKNCSDDPMEHELSKCASKGHNNDFWIRL